MNIIILDNLKQCIGTLMFLSLTLCSATIVCLNDIEKGAIAFAAGISGTKGEAALGVISILIKIGKEKDVNAYLADPVYAGNLRQMVQVNIDNNNRVEKVKEAIQKAKALGSGGGKSQLANAEAIDAYLKTQSSAFAKELEKAKTIDQKKALFIKVTAQDPGKKVAQALLEQSITEEETKKLSISTEEYMKRYTSAMNNTLNTFFQGKLPG